MKMRLINIVIFVFFCISTDAQKLGWARFYSLNTDISRVTQLVYPKIDGNAILNPDIDLPSPQKTIDYYLNEYKLIDRKTTISEGKERTVLFSYIDDVIVSRVDIPDTLYYSFDDSTQLYTSYRLSDRGIKKIHSQIKHNENYQVEEYTFCNNNGTCNRTEYSYDDQGLLITKNYYGKSIGMFKYDYDKKGRLVKETKSLDNGFSSVTTTTYSANQAIRKEIRDKIFQIDTVEIISNVLKVTKYIRVDNDGESKLHHMKSEKSNENGNPLIVMDYIPWSNQTEITKFIYNY